MIWGPDDLKEGIDELYGKPFQLSDNCLIAYSTLFPNDFMAEHTTFESLRQMLDACLLERRDELRVCNWSAFVGAHSEFSGWEAMFSAAHGLYLTKEKKF